jgi:hypothetical protein
MREGGVGLRWMDGKASGNDTDGEVAGGGDRYLRSPLAKANVVEAE